MQSLFFEEFAAAAAAAAAFLSSAFAIKESRTFCHQIVYDLTPAALLLGQMES